MNEINGPKTMEAYLNNGFHDKTCSLDHRHRWMLENTRQEFKDITFPAPQLIKFFF